MGLTQALFFTFAALALASALSVVFTRHTVWAAYLFVAHLLCLAVLYACLSAPLVAVLQVMVYGGAVMVLFIFAIMILDASVLGRLDWRQEALQAGLSLALGLGLAGLLFYVLDRHAPALALANPVSASADLGRGNVAALGRMLYTQYLLPFEVISVLLVVAAVGILVMAKRKLED